LQFFQGDLAVLVGVDGVEAFGGPRHSVLSTAPSLLASIEAKRSAGDMRWPPPPPGGAWAAGGADQGGAGERADQEAVFSMGVS
jgi:hypothetical protein